MRLTLLLFVWSFVIPHSSFAAPPNILFVLSDDHSYPFIHCYGREEMKTPNLDRFAAEGIMCRRMFTGAPQCVPSHPAEATHCGAAQTGRPVSWRHTRPGSPA